MDSALHFGTRLGQALRDFGPVCAGIDPHSSLLDQWGLPDSADGVLAFGLTCVEALAGQVACVKPQSAFFEQHGAAGVVALERVVEAAREAGVLCLLDVKRGDIGSTMAAYARGYLSDDSPLRVDAITVSPYLGYESLRPALQLAEETGRGVFVLGLTSNPEGSTLQTAVCAGGMSVAGQVVAGVASDNARITAGRDELGPFGVVVGATTGALVEQLGLDLRASKAPLLVPGFGAQGGTRDDVVRVCRGSWDQVVVSSSRDILRAGPSVSALRVRARDTTDAVASALAS